jgi:DNA-binding winged helix-turn-helix (wHTH) protein/tetratricopeptide (TPR) repeat protein
MKAFHAFRLDTVNQCLRRGDERLPITPKAYDVLRYLVEHPGRLITQDEILDALWPETYVQPEILRKYILEIRKVLGDRLDRPLFVETIPKRGYQFVAPVSEEGSAGAESAWPHAFTETLAGREEPLQRLERLVGKASNGWRQIVFITGEAGIGKTSLLDKFEQTSRRNTNTLIARGQCVEGFGGKESYYPVLEALGQLARYTGIEAFARMFARHAPTWLVQFPAMLNRDQKESLHEEILGASRDRMVRELCEAFEVITTEKTLLLSIEDIHWADPSTLDLISALARRRAPARLLLLGTYRPVDVILSRSPLKALKQDLLLHRLCDEIALERLSEKDVESYLASRSPNGAVPQGMANLVYRHSGGNPLFMTAIIQEMGKKGQLTEQGGRWTLNSPVDTLDPGVPQTLQEMLQMQFERLEVNDQRILRCSSVCGERFSAWATSTMLEDDTANVEGICDRLAAREQFLRPAGMEEIGDGSLSSHYEFRHALYREFLYKQIAVSEKRRFHRLLAIKLEALTSPVSANLASQLALHFEEGRDFDSAIKYLTVAAKNAARRYARNDSVEILKHALELIANISQGIREEWELSLLESLGDAYYALGDMAQSAATYVKMAAVAERSRLTTKIVTALVHQAAPMSFLDPDACIAICERASQVSVDQDHLLQARAELLASSWRILFTGWNQRDSAACSDAMARVRTASKTLREESIADDHILYAHVLCAEAKYESVIENVEVATAKSVETHHMWEYLYTAKAHALLWLGRLGDAHSVLCKGLDLCEKNRNLPWVTIFRDSMALLKFHSFDFEGARQDCLQHLQGSTGEIPGLHTSMPMTTLGLSELELGNPEGAVKYLEGVCGRSVYPRVFIDWYWRIIARWGLAHAWLESGDINRAKVETEALFEATNSCGNVVMRALAWDASARVAMAGGDDQLADESLSNALALLKNGRAPIAAWRIYVTAANLARRKREPVAAEKYRETAYKIIAFLGGSFQAGHPLKDTLLRARPLSRLLDF